MNAKHKILFLWIMLMPVLAWGCKKDSIAASIQQMLDFYPQSTLTDIYKSAFQNRFGPGHIISDVSRAQEYLTWELAQPVNYENPPYEPTLYDGRYVRVNLKLITDGIVDYETFLNAFIESANQVQAPSIEEWTQDWNEILQVVESMDLDLPDFEIDKNEIEARLQQGNYVGHHSETYSKAYDPHYRIIRRDIFDSRIFPLINSQITEE